MTKVIIFDTETTGLPKKRNQNSLHEPNCWPDIVSVSWSVFSNGEKQSQRTFLIKPENWTIPVESSQIHGITHEHAMNFGVSLRSVMDEFKAAVGNSPPRGAALNIIRQPTSAALLDRLRMQKLPTKFFGIEFGAQSRYEEDVRQRAKDPSSRAPKFAAGLFHVCAGPSPPQERTKSAPAPPLPPPLPGHPPNMW